MIWLLGGTAGLLVALALVRLAATAEPAALARVLRLSGPVLLALAAIVMLALGRGAVGGLCLAAAVGLFWWAGPQRLKPRLPARPRSSVRSAALEMELDHGSGGLEGLVLAGRHEQRTLSSMSLPELMELYADLRTDSESLQLLEAYLDGRFPVWRANAKADGDGGKGIAPGAGSMTEEEAYKVLGLEAGASAAEIRKAHRRLIQRLKPDVGATSALALRINRAKDILLAKHD